MKRMKSCIRHDVRLLLTVLFLAGALPVCGQSPAGGQGNWQLLTQKDGIRVLTRGLPDSGYHEYQGIMTVQASLRSVVALLTDPSKCPLLYKGCVTAEVLQRVNDHEYYVYTVYDAPWPFKNRDAVLRCVGSYGRGGKRFTLQYTGAPNYLPERPDIVRIRQLRGMWQVVEQPDGQLQVVYQAYNEPGGNVTPALSNARKERSMLYTLERMLSLLDTSPALNRCPGC